MATVAASPNGVKFYSGGWSDTYQTTSNTYAGKTKYNGAYTYYVSILKFTLGSFIGLSKKITLKHKFSVEYGSPATLHWALCNSDSNYNSYKNTKSKVTDANQIASGTITYDKTASQPISLEISTSSLRSGATYYLFLWGGDEKDSSTLIILTRTGGSGNHEITLEYYNGVVNIYTTSGWKKTIPWIYTSSGWKQTIPYVYNNGWKNTC